MTQQKSKKEINSLILNDIAVNKKLVRYKFSFTGAIADFFTADELFVEYDCDMSDVPESILAIPFVGSFVALTWLTDTAFFVKEIDYTFYQSLKSLKVAYQELYPHYPMGGRFVSARVMTTHGSPSDKSLLLFSGGADAMTSYLRHIDKDLLLCNVQGWHKDENSVDAVAQKEFKIVADFGEKHNRQIALIRSNFATLVNEHAFIKKIGNKVGDTWWHGFSHSMSFISLSIPVSYLYHCNEILIASSFTIGDSRVCASYATTDIEFSYGDGVRTVHDGFELSRQDKIKVIVDYQRVANKPFPLKVCSFKESNCGYCEKCFRTIAGIIAEGGNPNDFGFNIKGSVRQHFMDYFESNMQFFGIRNEMISHWPYIRKRMVANMQNVVDKDFAEWFLTYDFAKARRTALSKHYRKSFFAILRRKLKGDNY